MFDANKATGLEASYSFKLSEYGFVARVHDQTFEIDTGETAQADVTFEGEHDDLAGLVYGGADLEGMLEAGAIKLEGDKQVFEAFLTLFPLPAARSV